MDMPAKDADPTVFVAIDCVCSAGADLDTAWARLAAGGSGVQWIDRYDPEAQSIRGVQNVPFAAQVEFPISTGTDDITRWKDHCHEVVSVLVRRVLRRLEFDIAQHDPQRIGVLGGTALGSMESTTALFTTGVRDAKYILKQCPNMPLAVAAAEFGLQGPSFNVAGACASSAHTAMLAHMMLQTRSIDCALVVGFEFPITPPAVAGMEWIGALYRRNAPADRAYDDPAQASRPFSKDRRGLVLGEGAGIVVMTRRSYAMRMNWPVLSVLRGGYVNSDALHVTRIAPENVVRCISSALQAAECNADEIECINAHATSTPQGDAAELSALQAVFGDRLKTIPVVANKSQIGHTLGAAAVLALVLSIHGMNTGVVLPTLNYIPDEELPAARISPAAMEHRHTSAIVNAFGFGGTNVSVVLQRPVTT